MEFADVVTSRRMVRHYDPTRLVPPGLVSDIVSVGVRAPTAGFSQGVSFLVMDTEDAVNSFWRCANAPGNTSRWLEGMRTAPVLVLLWTDQEVYRDRYAEPDKGWVDRDVSTWSAPFWFVDAGMAAMAILLAAVDRGLGACFFGIPPTRLDTVRQHFGVPAEQMSVGVVSLGYADNLQRPSGSPTRRARRARDELVRFGRW